jgi:hypothetical protein
MNQRFLSGKAKKQSCACCLLQAGYLLDSSDSENGGDKFLRNVSYLSMDYKKVILQKTEIFMTTAVRTSSPMGNEKELCSMKLC